jgi:hypothetical protein
VEWVKKRRNHFGGRVKVEYDIERDRRKYSHRGCGLEEPMLGIAWLHTDTRRFTRNDCAIKMILTGLG